MHQANWDAEMNVSLVPCHMPTVMGHAQRMMFPGDRHGRGKGKEEGGCSIQCWGRRLFWKLSVAAVIRAWEKVCLGKYSGTLGGIPPGPRSSPKWCAMIWHWLKFFLGRRFPFPDFFNSWLLNLLVREEGFYNAFWLTRDSPMSVLTSAPCCQGSCSSKMRRVKFRGDWATSLSHKAGKEQSCLVSHI